MKTTRRTHLKTLGTLALGLGAGVFTSRPRVALASEPSPAEILKRADDVRNPAEAYFLRARVVSADHSEPSIFEVSLLGNTRTLVKTLAPARDKGRNLLMLDEDMWVYLPNLKRAVRISLNQRLVGQAANGDISRMRWSGDYQPRIEKEDDKEWTLFLAAKKKGLTYDQLRVWIEKGTFRPLRAEYLTLVGNKVLKRATFRAYKELCGKVRPTEIEIRDAVREAEHSVIHVDEMVVRAFPASLFVPENLQ